MGLSPLTYLFEQIETYTQTYKRSKLTRLKMAHEAHKTTQGSLNFMFGDAAVLPALRARSAAPPAGVQACQIQPCSFAVMPP